MKTLIGGLAAFATAAALAFSAAAAQSAPSQSAPSQSAPASIPAPRLASGVKAQAGYEAVRERFVLAAPTPIFADVNVSGMPVGRLDQVGQPVTLLAKVQGWDWYLVGRDGAGVGYVPRSLLKPAGS